MPNIFETKITSENVVKVWEADRKNKAPYMGELFFPVKRQVGLKFEFLKGKEGLPVALVPANWNTNVLYRDRIGVEQLSAKLPFFKEAYKVDEELRQDIITAKEQYVDPMFDEIFNDTNNLLDGADVAVERMRMQLLSQGTITIQANGVDKQYDYGFASSTQFKTLGTLWSATGAKPFNSFVTEARAYKKLSTNTTKAKAEYAIMNQKQFDALANDPEVLGYFAKLQVPVAYPTEAQVKAYVESVADLRILINDKQYLEARDFGGVAKDFYPDDRITFTSTLDLGNTIYGTTPEEVDLKSGSSTAASVSVTGNGVTVTTWKETDPVNVNVKVSEVVAPSCPNIDKLYIVKVF